jgi:hypothetical protein
MKTLRVNRLQPQSEPELLIRFAFYLLEQAGAAPTQFVTVAQLASWLGCDRETIRSKIRHGAIEAYFDRRFLQYAVPLPAAERLLAARGLTIPDEFATAQSVLALIPGEIMITDPKEKSGPLSPFEKTQLEQLLQRLEGSPTAMQAAEATAEDAREERRLRKERERLAAEEQKAAGHLADLRAALDRISGEIDAMIARKPGSFGDKHFAGAFRPGTIKLRRQAQEYAEYLREALAKGMLTSVTAEQLISIFEAGIEDFLNPPSLHVTLREYLAGLDRPSGRNFDESSLLDRLASRNLEQNGELSPEEQAEEIVRVGKKWGSGVFRDDALPPSGSKQRRQ